MSAGCPDLQTATLETTWGPVLIEASRQGVCSCTLPEAPANPDSFRVQRIRLPRKPTPLLKKATTYARALFEGRRPGAVPPLDASIDASTTAFRSAVWKEMRKIPRGKTATYAELARQVRSPAASRAVGSACGANPVPLFTPCHRVVAAGGKPGGFSSGLAWKILLLNGEGVPL